MKEDITKATGHAPELGDPGAGEFVVGGSKSYLFSLCKHYDKLAWAGTRGGEAKHSSLRTHNNDKHTRRH